LRGGADRDLDLDSDADLDSDLEVDLDSFLALASRAGDRDLERDFSRGIFAGGEEDLRF